MERRDATAALLSTDPQSISEVNIDLDTRGISVEQFVAVVRYGAPVRFTQAYEQRIQDCRNLIEQFLRENRRIYGVTTGFGENVRYVIPPEDAVTLQKNIIHSHSCSVGRPLEIEQVRAIMLMQILNMGSGFSGASLGLLRLIRDMLNANVTPWAPGEGSVGYLAVEGHLARTYIGSGRVFYQGEWLDGADGLAKAGLSPIVPGCKEGLCLLNGSTSVTALAVLALYDAVTAAKSIDLISALSYEALNGTIKGCDSRLHSVKDHVEQQRTARLICRMLEGSEIMDAFRDARVQDPYVLRCTPQFHGAAKRMLRQSCENICEEMRSVSDNPILFSDEQEAVALMGGNFDGSYVGGAADMICIAAGMLAKISERRTDRMVNRFFNDDLPAFLVKNPGMNNGFMIPQYTAAGLVSEIRILAHPASVDSVPTCANQEDPVSMAYTASCKAYETARKLQYIAAIELMTACQAMDCRADGLKPARETAAILAEVRKTVPTVENDRYYGDDMENLFQWIRGSGLVAFAEERLGALEF